MTGVFTLAMATMPALLARLVEMVDALLGIAVALVAGDHGGLRHGFDDHSEDETR
jgi:hypothetical protein